MATESVTAVFVLGVVAVIASSVQLSTATWWSKAIAMSLSSTT